MRAAVYAGTRNVYQDMIPSMKSLLIHSNVEKIYFLIEDDKFPYELPPEVECINVSKQKWFDTDCINMKNRCSYMVLLRVVFCQLFPHLDRILTIDNDTIVKENISDLWYLNMDDYYIAGCTEFQKSTPDFTYINMGVAMINLKKWREDGLDKKLVKDLHTYYFEETEQTAINMACQGHILVLNAMYNRNNYTDQKMGREKIIHYAAVKNWQSMPLVQKYRDIEIEHNKKDDYSLDIIIPHYNNVRGLRDTLESIDYDIVTVTVVDDCSTAREGLDELIREFPQVHYYELEHNSGPGAARQFGIEHTNNPYFMFIDAGDCIASKRQLRSAAKSIMRYSMAYIISYAWWNEDGDHIIKKDATLLPGTIFQREFIELYNIRFNTTPECSYSNEDRGFMAPCKLIMEYIRNYCGDRLKRIHFKENVLYSRLLDENSITQADNGSFYYYKHIPGLAHNAEHIVNICKENGVHWFIQMRLITFYLVYLYECYLRCAKEHPENLQDNIKALKYFYTHAYKRFEHVNAQALQFYYYKQIPSYKQYVSALEPRPNINRFLRLIKDD